MTHLPLITTVALPFTLLNKSYSHTIITSKETIRYMNFSDQGEIAITIGPSTSQKAKPYFSQIIEAKMFTQEGVLEIIDKLQPKGPLLYPRSIKARSYLAQELILRGYEVDIIDVYDTISISSVELPDLALFDRIFFTSPSCVSSFFKLYNGPYLVDKFHPIGPITEKKLLQKKKIVEHTPSR
ncbi:MAG: uroporphyrinogen-III synthase [Rhabdochlamydiaceae bacterium]|nr:uroporphyrinogen-III synthase [Candidatus Amphrikana amoebophyrae]